jgi:hypothetical protein
LQFSIKQFGGHQEFKRKNEKQLNLFFGMETWWPLSHLMLDCE